MVSTAHLVELRYSLSKPASDKMALNSEHVNRVYQKERGEDGLPNFELRSLDEFEKRWFVMMTPLSNPAMGDSHLSEAIEGSSSGLNQNVHGHSVCICSSNLVTSFGESSKSDSQWCPLRNCR
jgi:hypothetical protein